MREIYLQLIDNYDSCIYHQSVGYPRTSPIVANAKIRFFLQFQPFNSYLLYELYVKYYRISLLWVENESKIILLYLAVLVGAVFSNINPFTRVYLP